MVLYQKIVMSSLLVLFFKHKCAVACKKKKVIGVEFQLCSKEWRGVVMDAVTLKGRVMQTDTKLDF